MEDGGSSEPEGIRDLVARTQEGDADARAELRRLTQGKFEGKPKEDIPPMFRAAYTDPLEGGPVSFGELRASREYEVGLVDDFVDKICEPSYIPPGAAMMLFVFMCTKMQPVLQNFPTALRMKLMAVFRTWDESHHWVQANVLDRLRHRLFEEHHHVFVKSAFGRARRADAKIEEAKCLAEEMDGKEAEAQE